MTTCQVRMVTRHLLCSAILGQLDTVAGGNGDDTSMSNDAVVVDSDCINAASVKTLTAAGTPI